MLHAVRDAMLHAARAEALKEPIIASSEALLRYLQIDMAREPAERFRVLFLNAQNCLLDETVTNGSIDDVAIYPREIMRRSLNVGATALIMAHNHPSGACHPSESDIRATRAVVEAGRVLGVVLHDHVIISTSGWVSFRALGLL